MNDESIASIIDKSIILIHHHLEINKITLVKEFPADEIKVHCNSQKIQQALMSLLINAIEAMPNGGTITIALTQNQDLAVIKIIDEGTGILEKDLPNIFEPFYSTKEASKGTGLGLAVVYGIINNHGGQVIVEKTSERGTTFKITLPKKN
jgi:signal transduction histidine kinase